MLVAVRLWAAMLPAMISTEVKDVVVMSEELIVLALRELMDAVWKVEMTSEAGGGYAALLMELTSKELTKKLANEEICSEPEGG